MALKQSKYFLKYCVLSLLFFVFCFQNMLAENATELDNGTDKSGQHIYESNPTGTASIDKDELKKQADKLNFEELVEKPRNENKRKVEKVKFNIQKRSAGGVGKEFIYVIAFLLLLGIVIFAIFQLSRKNIKIKEEKLVHTGEETSPQNLARFKLKDSLSGALDKGDYRLAVRLLYLNLLKKLMENGLILPSPEKTNFDYVRELKGKTVEKDFYFTTGIFEKVWYGESEIDETKYMAISQSFAAIDGKINTRE